MVQRTTWDGSGSVAAAVSKVVSLLGSAVPRLGSAVSLSLLLVCLMRPAAASPVVYRPGGSDSPPLVGEENARRPYCYLPSEFDYNSYVALLEDCQSLERFPTVPMVLNSYGIHPMVCCPKRLDQDSICFPSDAWCPTFEDPFAILSQTGSQTATAEIPAELPAVLPAEVAQEESVVDLGLKAVGPNDGVGTSDEFSDLSAGFGEMPTMADRNCGSANFSCTALGRCPTVPGQPLWPGNSAVCGFDTDEHQMMVCCPVENVQPAPAAPVPPRFPSKGSARPCEDRHRLCRQWKEQGACELGRHFVISEKDPGNGRVDSVIMFRFMAAACPAMCGWCGAKGCVDEHALCPDLAKIGACSSESLTLFMVHSCRESCGVCGYLSPLSTEIQRSKDGAASYTDHEAKDFSCGRLKSLKEINGEDPDTDKAVEVFCKIDPDANTEPLSKPAAAPAGTENIAENEIAPSSIDLRTIGDKARRRKRQAATAEEEPFFYFSSNGTAGEINCGGTIISDRWVLSAAHCYDDFGESEADSATGRIRLITIRTGTKHKEVIEMKRAFKHPLYKFGRAYDDIALLELGRRIVFDFDNYGDTPTCLDLGQNIDNKIATVQGFGLTEKGTKGDLLEGNITIISNEECMNTLNTTLGNGSKEKINKALPHGLNYGLFCAQDKAPLTCKNETVYRSACSGDSGGPLYYKDDEARNTLVGIVSGGVDCVNGYPGWYTKVSFFRSWIRCIINTSLSGDKSKFEIAEACRNTIEPEPEEETPLFDLRG